MRTFRNWTLVLAVLLVGCYPEQILPLVVSMVAGMLVVVIERLTREG